MCHIIGGVYRMEQDFEYKRQLINRYREDVEPLFRYITWLDSKKGAKVSSAYADNDLAQHSMSFPVYDGTLLSFVKEVQKTKLLDRNYLYTYARYSLPTPKDERELINSVTLINMEILTGILSKYVMGGMTKGWLWSQAVEEGIFLAILLKFKELFEMWGQPVAEQGEQE